MPKTNRNARQLVAHLWDSEDPEVEYMEDEKLRRWLGRTQRASFTMNDYTLMLWDLGIEITPALHLRMLEAAEHKVREDAIAAGEVPEEPRHIPIYTSSQRHEPVVYYMRLGSLVKIGWSTNIRTRMDNLTGQGVMALEPGGSELEHRRHKQFADLHNPWRMVPTRGCTR